MGTLTGSNTVLAGTETFNLSSPAQTDWIQFPQSATSVNRKSGGGSTIGLPTLIGSGVTWTGYTDGPKMTWTDGTPTASATALAGGIYVDNTTATGQGYQIVLPADTTSRTATIYWAAYSSACTLTATLSDGSATAYTVSPGTTGSGNQKFYSTTITWAANSASQTLTIKATITTNVGSSFNVMLHAVKYLAAATSLTATLAGTLAGATGSIAASESLSSSISGALSGVTGALSASQSVAALISGVLSDITGSMSASERMAATLSATLAGVSGAVSVSEAISAALSAALAGVSGAISAGETVAGSVSGALSGVSGAVQAGEVIPASISGALAGVAVAVAASESIDSAVAGVLAGVTGSIAARVIDSVGAEIVGVLVGIGGSISASVTLTGAVAGVLNGVSGAAFAEERFGAALAGEFAGVSGAVGAQVQGSTGVTATIAGVLDGVTGRLLVSAAAASPSNACVILPVYFEARVVVAPGENRVSRLTAERRRMDINDDARIAELPIDDRTSSIAA